MRFPWTRGFYGAVYPQAWLRWWYSCVAKSGTFCVCVFFFSPDLFRGVIKRLGTLTSFILALFWYLKASRPRSFLFAVCVTPWEICALVLSFVLRTLLAGKTIYFMSYYIPDRTEGFCVMDCEKGVKFGTLYPRRVFFFPSLTVERDWNSLISGLLCPYLGMPVLTLRIGWNRVPWLIQVWFLDGISYFLQTLWKVTARYAGTHSFYSEWRHHVVLGSQSVYIKRTSAQSVYSRVRLRVSTRG